MDLGRFPDTLDVRRGANPPTRASRPDAPVSLDTVAGLLQGLNAEQKRAVTHGDGPLLVVAGPGTGKTQVITRRVAWLIATKRARPSEILALTFTDRAAAEMQGRVDQLVPYGYADTAIHTFHAFGDRLIREFAFELGLPDEPRLLSRADVVVFLRDRLFELELDRYRPLGNPTRFLGALADLFSRARDEDISPEAYAAFAGGLEREARRAQSSALDPAARAAAEALMERAAQQVELGRAYARYLELLGAGGCVDHGSQLALAVRLLRDHPAVRAELERRYRYVLVDEFQDTNAAQLALLGLLCTARRSITAVGDDDQSIYTFRGAAEANAQRFPERFPGARRIFLRRNYRSRAPILEAAGRLIANNGTVLDPSGDRRPPLRAHRRGGTAQAVEQRAFATVADEADWIAATVADRLTAPGARPQDFAVLVRTNAEAEPVLRSLNLRGVPWRFSGVSRLYARPEIRALLCFLRAVADLDSTIDLYGVATAAPYGLGGTDLTILLEHGRRSHRSLWQSCCELIEQPRLLRVSTATRERVTRLVADFKAASSLAHDKPAGDVLYAHLKRTGELARLTAAESPESETHLVNVARFFEIVQSRSRLLRDSRVAFFVEHLETLIEAGDDPLAAEIEEAAAVSVLTIHKAKGLEFPVVFIPGLVEGRFPARQRREPLGLPDELRSASGTAGPDDPSAEERRLLYVAMTRARDQLYLSYGSRSEGRSRRPSSFIAEALDRPATVPDQAPVETDDRSIFDQLERGEPSSVAPVGTPPERLTVSFSQLDDYLTCPQKFRLRHVLRVPVPPHHSLIYGSALHAAVAAYHGRQSRGVHPTVDELLEVFAAHWSSEGFLARQHEEARFLAGQMALRRFHRAQAGQSAPAAIEEPFSFTLDGHRIKGRFDRVDVTPEGAVITDYKSSDVRDPVKAARNARDSLQLAIYAMAHQAEAGALPVAVQLHYLDSGLIGRAQLDDRRLERARQQIRTATDGMRRRDFEAQPNYVACSFCPYRDICPSSAA